MTDTSASPPAPAVQGSVPSVPSAPPQTAAVQGATGAPKGAPPSESLIGGPAAAPAETSLLGDAKAAEPPPPITYGDFVLPEGFQPNEAFEDYKKFAAGELRLSQDQAQRVMDFHFKEVQKMGAESDKLWNETRRGWRATVEADPEIGGSKMAQTKAIVAKALDRYGNAEVREALGMTGAGDHPAIVKFIARMSAALVEGGPGPSGQPSARPQSAAERLYPNMSNGAG